MEKSLRFWIGATFLFLGIIIGFLIAPIKNGIYCGNYSGNTYLTPGAEDEEDELKF